MAGTCTESTFFKFLPVVSHENGMLSFRSFSQSFDNTKYICTKLYTFWNHAWHDIFRRHTKASWILDMYTTSCTEMSHSQWRCPPYEITEYACNITDNIMTKTIFWPQQTWCLRIFCVINFNEWGEFHYLEKIFWAQNNNIFMYAFMDDDTNVFELKIGLWKMNFTVMILDKHKKVDSPFVKLKWGLS